MNMPRLPTHQFVASSRNHRHADEEIAEEDCVYGEATPAVAEDVIRQSFVQAQAKSSSSTLMHRNPHSIALHR